MDDTSRELQKSSSLNTFRHYTCPRSVAHPATLNIFRLSFCLLLAVASHILHFSDPFKHSPEYTVPESHQRAGKAPAFEHFRNATRLHKMPRLVAHPLTSNTFCSVSPFPVTTCLTYCTFRVLLNTSGRRLIQSTAGYIQRAEESTHL